LDARPLAMEWRPLGLGFRKMALRLAERDGSCGSGAARVLAKIAVMLASLAMTGSVFTRTSGLKARLLAGSLSSNRKAHERG